MGHQGLLDTQQPSSAAISTTQQPTTTRQGLQFTQRVDEVQKQFYHLEQEGYRQSAQQYLYTVRYYERVTDSTPQHR